MKYKLLLIALMSASVAFAEPCNTFDCEQELKSIPCAEEASPGCIEYQEPMFVEEVPSCQPEPCVKELHNRCDQFSKEEKCLTSQESITISVVGQGVAPMNTISPAQAYALAKRAAIADSYRLIAEKVKGVRVDGQDLIRNMMVKRSTVRTSVQAMVRNSNIVETKYEEGLCEVEMEIVLYYSQFVR